MATKNTRKMIALGVIVALLAFIAIALVPYVSAVFGAIIFYVLFHPLFRWFVQKGMRKSFAAIIVVLCSILIILIPVFIVLSLVIGEVGTVMDGAQDLVGNLGTLDNLIKNVNIEQMAQDALTKIGSFAQQLVLEGFGKAAHMMISLTIMYFLFYFLLTNHQSNTKAVKGIVPFNAKNTERLISEGKNVTYSVVMTTGVIAGLQGFMVAIGFYFAGIPGAILWGIVGGILSFLPVVGTPVVWVPAVIFLFVQGNYVAAIGLLVWGLIIMNIDNVIRPIMQRRVAEMHPLISVIGVFIGIPYFGLLGLIIGPLILSYLVLTIGMFQEEYL